MHSRIFQVSSKPIEDFTNEFRYEDNFVPSVADYVVKQTQAEDIKADILWLGHACKGIKVDAENRTLQVISKEEYFEKQYEKFKELAEKMSNITMEDFMGTASQWDFYDLKSAYEDKHSFYIDDNDEYMGIATLDNWLRYAEIGQVYYIGSVFDYHF